MRRTKNNMGVAVGCVAPDVVGVGGLSGLNFGDRSINSTPPGFWKLTNGIVVDTAGVEKMSAATGLASTVVSGGDVSISQGEAYNCNVSVRLEEDLSAWTESFDDYHRPSGA